MSDGNYGQVSSGGDNESALAYLDKAEALHKSGDLRGAIEAYGEAIRLYPKNPRCYFCRGFALGETGDFDAAIRDLDQAISLKPDFANAYYLRGLTYDRMGKGDYALENLKQAIRVQPDHRDALAALDKMSPRPIGKRDGHLPLDEKIKYSLLVVFTLGIACMPFSRLRYRPLMLDARGEFSCSGCLFNVIFLLYFVVFMVCGFVFHVFRLLFLLYMGVVSLIKRKNGPNDLEKEADTNNT